MTPEEGAILSDIGVSILTSVTWIVTVTLLHGMFVLLFFISMITFLRRGLTTLPLMTMFIITLICFLVATLHWSSEIAALTIVIRSALVENKDAPLDVKRHLAKSRAQAPNMVAVWTEFLPIISDSIVIWRAWVLLFERRRVMIGPLLLLLSTVAMTFTYLGFSVKSYMRVGAILDGDKTFLDSIYTARLTLSFATNLAATLLIAYKLWTHRRFVINNLGLSRRTSQVQKVLILLVESGIAYCVLQVVNVALSLSHAPSQDSAIIYAAEALFAAYVQLSAMYPTIVIVLVNNQCSFMNTYGFNAAFNSTLADSGANIPDTKSPRLRALGGLSFMLPPEGGITDADEELSKEGLTDTGRIVMDNTMFKEIDRIPLREEGDVFERRPKTAPV